VFGLLLVACGPAVEGSGSGGDSATDGTSTTTPGSTTTDAATSAPPPATSTTAATATATAGSDEAGTGTGSTSGDPEPGLCTDRGCKVDILVVVDNSASTGEAQRALGLSMLDLEAHLRTLNADAQVMFTTTDVGNPVCTPFEPRGYAPARGAPVATACTDRLDDFTGLGSNPPNASEACSSVCPSGIAPIDDPFVAFDPLGQNVPELTRPVDVDGDGAPESETARALACLAPMGINGCGYESPLEAMLQALNPSAAWNVAERPFLRPDAALGIVLVTDEADCSIADHSMMTDAAFMETSPSTGEPSVTSAVCWNAGTDCEGPNADGRYTCTPNDDGPMHPTDRYVSALRDTLVLGEDKPVVMLGILGVPPVTEHNVDIPFEPVLGGLFDLVIRDWQDEDILPSDAAQGVTAADKQFVFGVGPGCSRPQSTAVAQAIPPVRIPAVCEALNEEDSAARCCIESICDDDYSAGMGCLTGMLTSQLNPLFPDG
jgi:hypothetical protein